MARSCRVRVPSTTANLGPGFDTLGLAVSIDNFITMEEAEQSQDIQTEILIDWPQRREISIEAKDDLLLQTLACLAAETGRDLSGVKIKEELAIGPARGLGSSATAIAGTLVAANHFFELDLSPKKLLSLACQLEGHPDNIVPALKGGLVIASYNNETEEIFWDKLLPHPALEAAIIVPELTSETAVQRSVIPTSFSLADVTFNLGRTALLPLAISSGRWQELKALMKDRLHQPYRCDNLKGWEKMLQLGYDSGALGIALSGAGPAILVLARENIEEIAHKMMEVWQEEGIEAAVFPVQPDTRGSYLVVEE